MFHRVMAEVLVLLAPLSWAPPPVESEIRAEALVKLVEQVEIPAREAGLLTTVDIREGDLIRHGQLIGQIDDSEAKLTLTQAAAELDLATQRAQSDVQVRTAQRAHLHAATEFERVNQIRQTAPRVVSDAELEKYRWEKDKAELEVERLIEERRLLELTRTAKSVEHAVAQHAVDRRRLTAPLAGIVVQVYRRPGEWVQIGERIARVLRIDRVRVEAFVTLQSDFMQLDGAPAVFEIATANRPPVRFSGEVVFVHPEIDPVNNQVRVWVEVENSDRLLRPGHRGRLTIRPGANPTGGDSATDVRGNP